MTKETYKVLIDDQIFRKQTVGGISNYFISLLNEFQSSSEIRVELGVIFYKTVRLTIHFGRRVMRYNSKALAIPAIILNSLKILAVKYDLIHSTFYSRWSIALLSRKFHIVTIHDMIPEDFPEFFDRRNPNKYKDRYIQNADGVIVVSEYTYERLFHHYPEISCPVITIPLASGFELKNAETVDLKGKFDEKRLLFVGPRGGYKNFEALLYCLEELSRIIPGTTLTCVGGGYFSPEEIGKITSIGLDKQIRQIDCDDEELKQLYHKSSLLVSSSLAEGFGLPSVEAASLCTPVIVGRNSYLGGILPENLVLDDVNNVTEMTKKIKKVLTNFGEYERSANSCYEKVLDLSWKNTSDSTIQFYLSILNKSENTRLVRFLASRKKID